MTTPSLLSDEELATSALEGSEAAFTDLYERYFNRIYDFLARMLRDPNEASDAAQDTFLRIVSGLGTRPPNVSFKAWLYTVARNIALNRIRSSRRTAPMPSVESEEGEELLFYEVVADSAPGPERTATSEELAALVWQAANGLNTNEYTLLDLSLRQGLEPQEVAEVLGVSRGNVYTMLSRLRDSFEQSVTALLLRQRGRQDCPELDRVLMRLGESDELSPRVRRAVNRHVSDCDICNSNRSRFVSAAELFGAFVPVLPAATLRDELLPGLLEQLSASTSPSSAESTPEQSGGQASSTASSASTSASSSEAHIGLWASSSIIAKIAAIVGVVAVVGVGAALVVTLVLGSDEASDDLGTNIISAPTTVSPSALSASPTTIAPSTAASLFSEPESFSIEGTGQIAVGDLDGNDTPDLALVNRETSTVSVLTNNGDGTFAGEVTYNVESFPGAITMGDLDGDDAPDLVTVLIDGRILVLYNKGDGTFADEAIYHFRVRPQIAAMLGDLNGDNALDLVVSHNNPNFSVFLNNGDGTFAERVTYDVDSFPGPFAMGNLDEDNAPDMVAALQNRQLLVLRNNGDGTFPDGITYDEEVIPTITPIVNDLDGNGSSDLAVILFSGGVSVLLNNGDGTFNDGMTITSEIVKFLVNGDLDQDGDVDLAATTLEGSILILLNNGDGTFSDSMILPVESLTSASIADLDGDGDLDLVFSRRNEVIVLRNNSR